MKTGRVAWNRTLGAVAWVLIGASVAPARAQFVPGHVFLPRPTTSLCETDIFGVPYDEEYIYEINPEDGSTRLFATIPRELCGNISGMVFSPDGRRLRVASEFLAAILEFDPQGNLSIPLYWVDGISSVNGPNCIAYDDDGNFYVANYGASNVLMFPAEGGPAEVLDEYDPNDVVNHVATPLNLAVAPDGTVYVLDYWLTTLVRITPQGQASLWDIYTGHNATLWTITVDEVGTVFLRETDGSGGSGFYRYFQGAPNREPFVLSPPQTTNGCNINMWTMSMDRSALVSVGSFFPTGQAGQCILSIDPVSGLYHSIPGYVFGSPFGMGIVPLRGDLDHNGAADLADYTLLQGCMIGPSNGALSGGCGVADLDADGDVDLFDFRFFQLAFGGKR